MLVTLAGITTLVIRVCSNASRPMSLTPLEMTQLPPRPPGNSMRRVPSLLYNTPLTLLKFEFPAATVIAVILAQSTNGTWPRLVTLAGRIMAVRPLH